jgi:hypothetical protein
MRPVATHSRSRTGHTTGNIPMARPTQPDTRMKCLRVRHPTRRGIPPCCARGAAVCATGPVRLAGGQLFAGNGVNQAIAPGLVAGMDRFPPLCQGGRIHPEFPPITLMNCSRAGSKQLTPVLPRLIALAKRQVIAGLCQEFSVSGRFPEREEAPPFGPEATSGTQYEEVALASLAIISLTRSI